MLDPILCDIVLDNALNNAFRHGHPVDPQVNFQITMRDCPVPNPNHPHRYRLSFEVTNRCHPRRPPLTPNFVSQAMTGQNNPEPSTVLSDNLGLTHITMAAEAHGMAVTLDQIGDSVVFEATVDVDMCFQQQDNHTKVEAFATLPSGIRILCLDDSAVARKLLAHFLATNLPGASVRVFGDTPEEVCYFMTDAVNGADLVVLDQLLEYGHIKFHGTDLIKSLVQQGFTGCICVRSANASLSDQTDYLRSGAHCTIGKDLRPTETIAQLTAAYLRFLRTRQPFKSNGISSVLPSFSTREETFSTGTDSPRALLPGVPNAQSFHCLFPVSPMYQ